MSNRELAAQAFLSRQREIHAFDMSGIGSEQEINSKYGYRHGWIEINGESFNRDLAFPDQTFPRFPADQGTND